MNDSKYKNCICKANGLSDLPCDLALERIYAMQTDNPKNPNSDINVGCEWYINSAEHNYSWWNYVKTLDEPIPDKEICQLLNISSSQLKEIYNSAIKKLQGIQKTKEFKDFVETVTESISNKNSDIYEYHSVSDVDSISNIVDSNKEEEEEPKKKTKPKKGFGMPIHRDQKKIDLYGLYSRKTLERKKNEKK